MTFDQLTIKWMNSINISFSYNRNEDFWDPNEKTKYLGIIYNNLKGSIPQL